MKHFKQVLTSGTIFCASLFLFSCNKQIAEPISTQSELSSQSNEATQCRPATFGVYSVYPSDPTSGEWTTLAQKWYENGKVKYLKAKHASWATPIVDPTLDFLFDIQWGEVSYQGNQVYLTDVVYNRLIMRVTLDNQQRPVASYYNYVPHGTNLYMRDTTYYYYSGDRLDNMISLYERLPYGTTPFTRYRKYVFSYDKWGDLVKAESGETSSFYIEYDYTKPVSGIINNLHITSSLKLLEYLELIQLPMHYAVTKAGFGISSTYKDYAITDGLVTSYVYDGPYSFSRIITLYNGWDCNASSSMSVANKPGTAISNLVQFQNVYFR